MTATDTLVTTTEKTLTDTNIEVNFQLSLPSIVVNNMYL